jgi:hypothetical protein
VTWVHQERAVRVCVIAIVVLSGMACDAAPAPAPAAAPVAVRALLMRGPAPEIGAGPTEPAAPVPARREGAYANLDPADDLIVGPPDERPDCDAELARAGVRYRAASLPVHTEHRGKLVCGAPQVVTYLGGPGDIVYEPTPLLTCGMALALASFEHIVQEEAARAYRSRVVRIEQLGTYSCREIAAYPGWVSEHSYANAIDLSRFILKNGTTIDVQRDFDEGDAPPGRPAGAFLRAVSQRGNDEDVFSHVLTPFFNAAHRNHFHLDLSRFRNDGTRPET